MTKDGSGIEITKELCKSHAAEVLKDVQELPDGDAKNAIIRIVNYLLNKWSKLLLGTFGFKDITIFLYLDVYNENLIKKIQMFLKPGLHYSCSLLLMFYQHHCHEKKYC